jgi:hypothetical protein
MTARQWTCEALDAAHPLPDGWIWCVAGEHIGALEVGGPFDPNEVWVDEHGFLATSEREPPADIAFAVILASRGVDSLGAMDVALEALPAASSSSCSARLRGSR